MKQKHIILLLSFCFLFMANTGFSQKYRVKMKTTEGEIELVLFNKTPLHTNNFVKLAKEGFYDSLLFHRVIKEFMIQGGDPNSKNAVAGVPLGSGGATERIPAEFHNDLLHYKGRLAAARDNNPEKASSNCQFYIVVGKKYTDEELDRMEQRIGRKYTADERKHYKEVGGTPHLDGTYTVYGEVTKGLDIVEKISLVAIDPSNRPKVDQRILKVTVKKKFLFFWI